MSSSSINKRILKKMGYLADQDGIIHRYLREQGGWDSHLLNCREYITKKVNKHNVKEITILGSGWLLDVPLEELSDICEKVTLVDLHHPQQIVQKVKDLANVNLVLDDITGGLIEEVWRKHKKSVFDPDTIEVPLYKLSFDPGLVISLNILTQTDTLLNDFLINKTRLDIQQHRRFRERIQSAHLELLKSYPHLLITDFEEEIIDIDNESVIETNSLLFTDLPDSEDGEEWNWIFDSSGEYYRRKRVIFKVVAYDNSGYE
jgi:hypothetical protein